MDSKANSEMVLRYCCARVKTKADEDNQEKIWWIWRFERCYEFETDQKVAWRVWVDVDKDRVAEQNRLSEVGVLSFEMILLQ